MFTIFFCFHIFSFAILWPLLLQFPCLQYQPMDKSKAEVKKILFIIIIFLIISILRGLWLFTCTENWQWLIYFQYKCQKVPRSNSALNSTAAFFYSKCTFSKVILVNCKYLIYISFSIMDFWHIFKWSKIEIMRIFFLEFTFFPLHTLKFLTRKLDLLSFLKMEK